MNKGQRHFDASISVPATSAEVFAYADDHKNFSSHMNQSSWMMTGGKMTTEVDKGRGQEIGSHIKMRGNVLGLELSLDEVITEHNPPHRKVWKTVGEPKLLVIGNYSLGFEINPEKEKSHVTVFIDYDLPVSPRTRFLGYLFGNVYTKWCVEQMLSGITQQFSKK